MGHTIDKGNDYYQNTNRIAEWNALHIEFIKETLEFHRQIDHTHAKQTETVFKNMRVAISHENQISLDLFKKDGRRDNKEFKEELDRINKEVFDKEIKQTNQ